MLNGDHAMISWRHILDKSPVEWLLEKENPSVRYFTLRDLFDKKESDIEVKQTKAAIPNSKVISKIFSKQQPEGFWESRENPYHPKYKSTYWQIMTLGQLGIDKTDKRVQKACEFVFGLQLDEGGFSSYTRERALQEYEWMRTRTHLKEKLQPESETWAQSLVTEHQYSCLTGNICTSMLRMGYEADSKLKKALDWLVKIQNADGGWLCPYWKAHIKDKHACFYGTICPLEAFSEVPQNQRTLEMKDAIEKGAEFLLMHRLYKADHHGYKIINRQWLKFSFPWFYGYHILRGLLILTKLGYTEDERMKYSVELLIQKRRQDGTWFLEGAPTGRMQVNIEAVGKPSKWITLNALRAIKRLSQTENRQLQEVLVKTQKE
jgi:hypothetical protein